MSVTVPTRITVKRSSRKGLSVKSSLIVLKGAKAEEAQLLVNHLRESPGPWVMNLPDHISVSVFKL